MPGGDNIGSRKLDMHFTALEAMGAELDVVHGFIEARCNALCGARVVLEFPSVGATETVLTAAVLAKGETVIENAAREPEVTDLASFLVDMGARIDGAGTSTITIEGVDRLRPAEHAIIGDRIEAGTLVMACGVAGGDIDVAGHRARAPRDGRPEAAPTLGMRDHPDARRPARARPSGGCGRSTCRRCRSRGSRPTSCRSRSPLLATAEGTAIVTENIFDNRFAFVDELIRMGADVRTEGRHAIVRGVARLSGAPVRALDVRAGAALVLAGLAADGETTIHEPHHVERGYADLAGQAREPRRRRPAGGLSRRPGSGVTGLPAILEVL